MGAVVLGHMPLALIVLPFVPTPSVVGMPYLAVGILLHVGYQFDLCRQIRTNTLGRF